MGRVVSVFSASTYGKSLPGLWLELVVLLAVLGIVLHLPLS